MGIFLREAVFDLDLEEWLGSLREKIKADYFSP